MKNNKATWVFLITLLLLFVISAFRLRAAFDSSVFPLLVFLLGLHTAISFFEWVCNLAPTSKWFSRIPVIRKFAVGGDVPFWHRQFIFFGGFGFGYIYMLLLG
jgi:uncharacterized protein YebE (UPF0316 family)